MKENKQPLLYTMKDVSHMLGVSYSWLKTYTQSGHIPYVRMGRRIMLRATDVKKLSEGGMNLTVNIAHEKTIAEANKRIAEEEETATRVVPTIVERTKIAKDQPSIAQRVDVKQHLLDSCQYIMTLLEYIDRYHTLIDYGAYDWRSDITNNKGPIGRVQRCITDAKEFLSGMGFPYPGESW